MAKKAAKAPATPFEKMLTAIITLVILAMLALAVFATYGKISENVEQAAIEAETTAIQNGEQEATVRYMANTAGMTTEEYLAQYGLELGGDLKDTSLVSEMTELMTVENYYKFSDASSGETTDVAAKLEEWGADSGITKDTKWGEVQDTLTIGKFLGEDEFNDVIEQYKSMGYDASGITSDMTINAANDAVEAMMKAGPVNTPAATEAADAENAGDAEAESAQTPEE